jgi:hypothetical protein
MGNKGAGPEPMEENHGGGQDIHRVVASVKKSCAHRCLPHCTHLSIPVG